MNKLCLLIACTIGLGSSALADNRTENTADTNTRAATPVDQKFVNKAASGGMAEVMLGKLALDKTSNADVKKFAQRMIDDHSSANKELESVAQTQGIMVPTTVDPKEQKLYDKLAKLDGDKFDKEYMTAMRKDHDEDVKEFEKATSEVKNVSLRNFATKTLPTLREHNRMAHSIEMKKE